MANNLDNFFKNSVGSRSKISDYTSKIDSTGDFKRIINLEVILNNWNNILLTPKRTVDHDPEFGSDIYKYVFENAEESVLEDLKEEIRYALMNQDDRAKITNINVYFIKGKKGFIIDIEASYNGNTGSLKAIIDENQYFNFQ